MKKNLGHTTTTLLAALRHLGTCQQDVGNAMQTHCVFSNGFATACDGLLSAGVPVNEPLNLKPHTRMLLNALEHCEDVATLSTTAGESLRIKSGPYSCLVRCFSGELQTACPDPLRVICGDSLRDALDVGLNLISEAFKDGAVTSYSVLLRNDSAIITNGLIMFEAWHGWNLGDGRFLIPRRFAEAVGAIDKKITGAGWTDRSFTLYYDDCSWIKTQLIDGTYPQVDKILQAEPAKFLPVQEFFKGAEISASFGTDTDVFYDGESCYNRNRTQEYWMNNGYMVQPCAFDWKVLKNAKKYAEQIGFGERAMYFRGATVRGCVIYKA